MNRSIRPPASRVVLASALLAWSGCGAPPIDPPPDAGPPVDAHEPPRPDAGVDAATDDTPPTVTSSRPRGGEGGVGPTTQVEFRFSERVTPTPGTVLATSGGASVALGEATWGPEQDVLRIAPATTWPSDSRIEIVVEGYLDLAGNAMSEPFELVFDTSDVGAPSVSSTSPTEGATGADPTSITIRFSEAMNPYLGTLSLEGGTGVLGARTWIGPDELAVEVAELAPGRAYRLVLSGFEDREGNALDPAPVLGDGALDWTTTADETAPTVVDSNPTDGQLDVDVARVDAIVVTFSEPMDRAIRTAVLTAASATRTLTGNWNEDATTLTFATSGRLTVDAEHALDLSGLEDAQGNALDPDANLTAGALTFTTSAADEAFPFVVFSTPGERQTGVSTRASEIELVFSEAMDTSRTAFELVAGGTARSLVGTWNGAGTRLVLPVGTGLAADTDFTLDVRAATDVSGNALDAAHPYLGDGVLEFRTGAPTGEDCSDPITVAQANRDGAAYVWELPGGAFRVADGLPSCSATSGIRSGVLAYPKTTGDLASGGRALRISVTSHDTFDDVQLEVFRDVCAPASATERDAARAICLGIRHQWTQIVDVPAGTHYLWIGSESADFAGATVRIEEIATLPAGDSCASPIDATSPYYSTPGTDQHRWLLPFDVASSVDHGTSVTGDTAIACASRQGPDAVVRVDKARTTSILDIEVEPFPSDSGLGTRLGVYVEALTSCEPGTDAPLECLGPVSTSRRFQLDTPGDVHLWVAAGGTTAWIPQTEIRVREVDPQPGETCRTAIPITPGASVPITPSSTAAYFAPSCITGPVTWYRFTTTRELAVVGASAAAPIALVDPASGAELGCYPDASRFGIPHRAPVGSEVCIAVPSGAAPSALAIGELDWRGVSGTPTDLAIERPTDAAGAPIAITTESWLAVSSSQLYMGINVTSSTTAALVVAPRAGHEVASRVGYGQYVIGHSGVAVGDAIFSVDDTNATARPNRLHRLVTPAGAFETGTAWDGGSSYGAVDIDAMARIAGEDLFILANDGTTTTPTSFFTVSSTTPSGAVRIGQNASLRDVVAIAASPTHVFVIGTTNAGRSVFRLARTALTAAPEPIAPPGELSLSTSNGSLAYDSVRDILYFRTTGGPAGVHAIFDASGTAPVHAGLVLARGTSGDHGLAIDPAVPALFLFETQSVSTGTFVELR